MRRLAARRTGGAPDNKPVTGRRPVVLLAGGLVVALVVVATVVWWPEDRSAVPPAGVSGSRASRAPTDPAALQQQLDGVVEAGAPGVVGLVRTGERIWQGASGLGDLRAERPARAGDRFRVGSVTKSFVATLVLQLVGEDRLGLDDSLERWLPGLVLSPPAGGTSSAPPAGGDFGAGLSRLRRGQGATTVGAPPTCIQDRDLL